MIQSIYKGIEIELEMHQQTEGYWKCDYMLITRPDRTVTRVKGVIQLPTLKMAKEYALEDAHAVIDNADDGFSPEEIATEIYPTVPLAAVRRIFAFARRPHAYPVG